MFNKLNSFIEKSKETAFIPCFYDENIMICGIPADFLIDYLKYGIWQESDFIKKAGHRLASRLI